MTAGEDLRHGCVSVGRGANSYVLGWHCMRAIRLTEEKICDQSGRA